MVAAYLSLVFLGTLGMRVSIADTRVLYIAAASAPALVGLISYRALASRAHTLSLGGDIMLGVACSLLAHPLMWLVALLLNSLSADPNGFIGMRLQAQLPAPILALVGSVFFSFHSLIYVGWITAAGAIVEGALAMVGRR